MLRLALLLVVGVAIAAANVKLSVNKDPFDDRLATLTGDDGDSVELCGDKLDNGRAVDAYALRAIHGDDEEYLDLKTGEFEHRDAKLGYVLRFRVSDKTVDGRIYFTKAKMMMEFEYDLETDTLTKMNSKKFYDLSEPCSPVNRRVTRGWNFKDFCINALNGIGFTCKFVNKRTKTVLYKVVCAVLAVGVGFFTPVPGDGLALTAACHTGIDMAIKVCKVASPTTKIGSKLCEEMLD